ncbi:hypothetical protein LB467_18475 [Salegentibacter sp. JZCK2]|uniref:hypothetical protein n=1 Tax=Salegentibacter tibetensis TaxID=2873600 RepID=UPI001CCD5DDA|nr:hypothetical protein [Salegentibacter tibetensis]MBZ9731674.1 hypothetical protein [Salegentibacter tibetensis]
MTKKDVEKLIEVRKESSFFNHFWNVLIYDFRAKGEIGPNQIKVWRQNMWNMTFYPIFTFEFNANNNLTDIKDEINPIGKTFIGVLLIGFLYLIFPKNLSGFDLLDHLPFVILITIFAFLIVLVARMVYRFEKQNQLEQIFEILDIEVEEKKPEREWTFKKIITRLLIYPFCIGLILFALFYLFPNGKVFMGIASLGFGGMYLYADIKILIEKKTTGNNV